MTPFRLAWLNVSRKRISSLIAALAVAVAVACGGVLLRLYELSGSRFSTLARGPDAIVGAKSGGIEILLGSLNLEGTYPGFLPMKLFESLRARQAVRFEDGASTEPNFVREIVPFLYFADAKGARVIATDETFLTAPGDAKSFASGAWGKSVTDAVAGSAVAERLGLDVGKTVEAVLKFGDASGPDAENARTKPARAMRLRITGVLAPTASAWDRGIYSNLATAREALIARGAGEPNRDGGPGAPPGSIWGNDVLHYFLVYLTPNGMKPLVDLVNKRTVGQVISVEAQRQELDRLTGSGRALGFIVTALIIALAGLCMLTLMLARFDAMATQIAVLRAIGYLRSEIALWLVSEGLLLGVAGCLLGAVLDGALFPIFRELLGTALPDADVVSSVFWQSWPIWLASLAAVTGAVFFPVWRMYQQDIQTSLKG